MPKELHNAISEFVNDWEPSATETPTALAIEKETIDVDESTRLLDDIERLAAHLDTGAITFWIKGNEDRYRIRYNPTTGAIQSERTHATDYELDQLYRDDPELVEALEQIDQNRITDSSNIRDIFDRIHLAEQLQLGVQYQLQKASIESTISQILNASDTAIHFYFYEESITTEIQDTPPAQIRNKLLEDEHSKALIIVLPLENYVYGDALGVAGLPVLPSLEPFINSRVSWRDDMEEIRRQTLIQDPDRRFLPASFFYIRDSSDVALDSEIRQLFARYVAFFSLISIANSAESRNQTIWHVRFQGRQFIEGEVDTSPSDSFIVRFDETEKEIELTDEIVDDLYALFSWTYSDDIDNRITVVRNVATLYARDRPCLDAKFRGVERFSPHHHANHL